MAAVARTRSCRGSNTRKAQLGGVVLPLPLSRDSRLFTLCSFEATPAQDAIWRVDFKEQGCSPLFPVPFFKFRVWGGGGKCVDYSKWAECDGEEWELSAPGNRGKSCFFLAALMATLVPFCQIHTTLRRRLPGLDSALIAPAADAFFFYSPCAITG